MKKLLSALLAVLLVSLCIASPLTASGARADGSGKVYHVAQKQQNASDLNDGSEASPFLTVSRAAELMCAGDTVVIHSGVYRERIKPARGGTSRRNMITYRAAEGEEVVINGSDVWTPD